MKIEEIYTNKKRKMFPTPVTPQHSPQKKRYLINNNNKYRNRCIKRTNLNNVVSSARKRLKFENIILPANKHPVYLPKDDNCYIEEIPPEILGMVFETITDFQELMNLSMVCKRWRQIVSNFSNPSFISEKYPVKMRKSIRNFQLEAITIQFPRIRQISLYNSPSIHHQGFQSIADNCHKLEVLKLHTVGFCPDTVMNKIMLNSPLQELVLNGNIELWNGEQQLPSFKLKKMVIIDNSKFFDKSVEILAEKCHQLESLFISRCSNFNLEGKISEYDISHDVKNITQFLKNNKNLKYLTLSQININNKVLEGIAECSQLQSLKIEDCFLISNEGIRKLVGKLPNLKHITINNTDCNSVAFNLLTDPITFPSLEEIVFNKNNRHSLINANQLYINDLITAIHNSRKEKSEKDIEHSEETNDEKSKQIKQNGGKFKLKLINIQEAFNPYEQNYYHKHHTENSHIKSVLHKIKFRMLF
jgi:hypothetical protein